MDVFLGIDLGTSYFKLGLFDEAGRLLGLGKVAAPVRSTEDQRREITVEDFWASLQEGLSKALVQAECSTGDIRGVSYASQANTFVLLDKDDQPLTPLILWTDRRASPPDPAVAEFQSQPEFLRTTGLGIPVGVELAVMKLRWFQTRQPELWRRVRRVMTISDYLTFRLTGRRVGDAGTAALLGLLNLPELDWWDAAVRAAGLTREQLSIPLPPGTRVGETTKEGVERFGLPAGANVTVGSLDHHVAALGAGVGSVAEVSISLGTVLACLARRSNYAPKPDCIMGPAVQAGHYYQLAFDENGAAVLEWYRNTFAPEKSFEELSDLAGKVSPGCEGLFFDSDLYQGCRGSRSAAKQPRSTNRVVASLRSANHGTLKPIPDRPGFRGVAPSYTHGHFVRAILESTAGTTNQLIESLCGDTKPAVVVAAGGGAKSEVWLEILARTTGVKFLPAPCSEAAVRGAAMLAAGKMSSPRQPTPFQQRFRKRDNF
ncbi:MAG: FGGY-family carbohydrate kinase [Phycisphaerae bacterium]|nr:FGGY-family carbohydrate kinase [Phycisphaerae bacterium]